jgi:putative transposase
MEKNLPQEKKIIQATKKIRIYPENEEYFHRATTAFRRAYNLSVESLNKNGKADKPKIVAQVIEELSFNTNKIPYDLVGEAVRRASNEYNKTKKKRSKLHFMSYKYSPHHFQIIKFKKEIWKKFLGKFSYAEDIPDEALLKVASVHYQNGEWYICVQKHIDLESTINKNGNIVALDPGIRTFQTSYSENQANKFGCNFFSSRIFPSLLKVDKLYGKRQNLENVRKEYGHTQWFKDRMKYYEKQINRTKARINHLINDLHHKVAYTLVKDYDIILLPTFESSQMVERQGRKINSKVVRSMLGLKHYQFKLLLKWYARKYGKVVIDVNEAYTSKTYNGRIIKVGSKEHFKVKLKNKNKLKVIDRDINGARNILLRFITKRVS